MTTVQGVMDEIDDYLAVIDSKLDRVSKNIDRLTSNQVRNAAEKKRIIDSCEKDLDRLQSDVKTLNYDLKRLPKDRESEYADKVTAVKNRIEKTDKKYKAAINGEQQQQLEVSQIDDAASMRSGVSVAKKKKKKKAKKQLEVNQESEYAINTQQSLASKRNKQVITFEEEQVSPEAVQVDIR